MIYTTNFLGSFLMTHPLEMHLSDKARVVFTGSTGSYSGSSVLQTRRQIAQAQGSTTGIFALPKMILRQSIKSIKITLDASSAAPAYVHSKAIQILFAKLLQAHFASTPDALSVHVFTPGFASTPIFFKFDVDWKIWLFNPLFAVLKFTEKWFAVHTDEAAKTGAWLGSVGGEIEGGAYWEWMTKRTSLVGLLRGVLGEEGFATKCREVWREWEGDAGVVWNVQI